MAKMIRVSDLVVKFFEEKNIGHVFLLSGGMMMNLLDSISRSEKIKYVCNHHEQACAIAAEAYARTKNDVGLCYATSGPGATNTITGIAGAWLDSVPVIFLTGQSRTTLTVRGTGATNLRMLGNFEVDIVSIVESITKYAHFVDNAEDVLYHLEKAYYTATEGRPGPVLLDMPLDIQGTLVDEEIIRHFEMPISEIYDNDFTDVLNDLANAQKPLLIAGQGIRAANQVEHIRSLIHQLQIPVVTTQLANDVLPYDDELYVGKVGLRGDRAGNFAVQNADLIITLGSSLHITTTGYELDDFASQAKKIVIDIDTAVLKKNEIISQVQIKCDVATAIKALSSAEKLNTGNWLQTVNCWKTLFPIINEPHQRNKDEINTYHLVHKLSKHLSKDEVIITDAGSLYYITGQAFLTKNDQRVIVSGALGAMGYSLPAAIGAAFAAPGKDIICITGDGSMQLNVQELQTIFNYQLNCKIIIINNKGYASIRNSQVAFTGGHIAAASESTGVTFPNWEKLAQANSLPYFYEDKFSELDSLFDKILAKKGPMVVEIVVPENVTMIPAVTSVRLSNGSFKSNKLDEMSPELSPEQLKQAGVVINS
ncbi:MAG TPA: thiamine pyrophosphate-binding protein [Mucilaginibacter sp.]